MMKSDILEHDGIGAKPEGKGEPAWVSWLRSRSKSPAALPLAYLIALSVAEMLTALFEPRAGVALHGLLLVILLLHVALAWDQPAHRLLLCLTFAPLVRILSLSLPLASFPLIYWYFIISVPLFIGSFITVRTIGFSWSEIGMNMRRWPLQIPVALCGVAFGAMEYYILRPEPLASRFVWQELWAPALILLICTGFLEELLFRGLTQRAANEVLGRFGVIYVAVLFAVLHMGYKSVIDLVFVFGVGLFFGWVVSKTGSLFGVTVSHGLTNIFLFLVMPFVFTL